MELFSLLAKLTLDSSEYESGIAEAERAAESFESPEEQTLELDASDFDDTLAQSEQNAEGFGENLSSVFEGVKGALVATGIVGAIAGVVKGIKEAVDMTAATADGIDKGSRRLGISAKNYQAWDHALRQSGASINDLQRGVLQFNKYIAGDKTEEMAEAFKTLGVDADKAGMSTEQLINDTLVALAGFKGSAEERGVLVTALFGKGGMNLNALLDSGKEGVEELLKEAEELGLIMSQDEIDNAVKYGDAVANLNAELDAIKQAFVANIIPVLTEGVSLLTDLLQKFNPRLRENSLNETFDQIDQRTSESIKKAEENKAKAEELVKKLAEMGDYWTLDEKGKKTYDVLLNELREVFPQIDEVLKNNQNAIYDNRDAILANIDAWTKLEQQRILDQNLADKKAAVAEKYAKALDKEIEAEVKETDVAAKRSEAIDEINKRLEENPTFKNMMSIGLGVDEVNAENVDNIVKWMKENGFDMANMDAVKSMSELLGEAEKLRSEAESMYSEADEAQKNLDKYAKALSDHLGITLTDATSVAQTLTEIQDLVRGTNGTLRVSFAPQAYTKAIGDHYIPYDNFPALLHRGERVLTATEARQENNTPDLSGLGNTIVSAIREGMENATVNSYMDGQLVSDQVSRNLAAQLANRRYV